MQTRMVSIEPIGGNVNSTCLFGILQTDTHD